MAKIILGDAFDAADTGVKSVGSFVFSDQPEADETLVINGVTFTWKASGASGDEINIGASVTLSIDAAVTVLNASVDADVAKATYSNVGGTDLKVTHDAMGVVGDTFTIVSNVADAEASGATLEGGVDPFGTTFTVGEDSDPASIDAILAVDGTFNSATVRLEIAPNGTDFSPVTSATKTAAGTVNVKLPPGVKVRMALTGANTTDLDVYLLGINPAVVASNS